MRSALEHEAAARVGAVDALAIVSCNVAHGRGLKPNNFMIRSADEVRARLREIGRQIARTGADIALLQEVDREASWSRGVDMVDVLMRETGLAHAAYQANYGVRLPGFRLCAGNAILARFPIHSPRSIPYETDARLLELFPGRKRGLAATLDLPGGEHLHVQCHHFHPRRSGSRTHQANRVLRAVEEFWLSDPRPSAVIIGGDFNMRVRELRRSALAGLHAHVLPPHVVHFEPTWPSYRPLWPFDHVMVQSDRWQIVARDVLPTRHSDHCPVVVRLERTSNAEAAGNGGSAGQER